MRKAKLREKQLHKVIQDKLRLKWRSDSLLIPGSHLLYRTQDESPQTSLGHLLRLTRGHVQDADPSWGDCAAVARAGCLFSASARAFVPVWGGHTRCRHLAHLLTHTSSKLPDECGRQQVSYDSTKLHCLSSKSSTITPGSSLYIFILPAQQKQF